MAGYFGGKDYGKHRKRRESLHRETQTQWELGMGKEGIAEKGDTHELFRHGLT